MQTLRSINGEKANSRKWKGFNRTLIAMAVVVALQPILDITPAVVNTFIGSAALLYGTFAGANAYTHGKGGENGK